MWSEEFWFEDGLFYGCQYIKGFTGLAPSAVNRERELRVVGRKRSREEIRMKKCLKEDDSKNETL